MMKVDEGLPKMFQRYNGKPTLMTASTRLAQVTTKLRLGESPLLELGSATVCSCIHVL